MEIKYKFILYLDMDGVTAGSNYIIKIHNALIHKEDEDKDFEYRHFMQQYCFQKEAVEFLNKLYDLVPYVIILSSTRRFEFTPTEWNTIFKMNRVKAYIGGRTKRISKGKHVSWREDEIEDYQFKGSGMFTFKNIPFLIIDDDIFDLYKYEDKLIHVNTETGLTMEYFQEAINKLKSQGVEINGYKESKSI